MSYGIPQVRVVHTGQRCWAKCCSASIFAVGALSSIGAGVAVGMGETSTGAISALAIGVILMVGACYVHKNCGFYNYHEIT